MKYQCPCCDYFTLEEVGNYDICPICFWENDGLDIDGIDKHSGPNHMTIREGRANFLKYGACEERFIKKVVPKKFRIRYTWLERFPE